MAQYPVCFPDLTFYQKTVACQSACPVRTDARGYETAIAQGKYERAYLIARETNPFVSTCGRVCGAPCEAACRRGEIDPPLPSAPSNVLSMIAMAFTWGKKARNWTGYHAPLIFSSRLLNSQIPLPMITIQNRAIKINPKPPNPIPNPVIMILLSCSFLCDFREMNVRFSRRV